MEDSFLGRCCFYASIVSLGILPAIFPRVIIWTLPPLTDTRRRRTQRREIPEGYPYAPSKNSLLRGILENWDRENRENLEPNYADNSLEDIKLLKLLKLKDSEVRNLTDEELDLLWSKTFSWRDRVGCFLSAPYVLFVLNSIFNVVLAVIFTLSFFEMRVVSPRRSLLEPSALETHDAKQGGNDMKQGGGSGHRWRGYEDFLAVYFACSLVREGSQLACLTLQYGNGKGVIKHFKDIWNLCDLVAPVAFCVGYSLRDSPHCADGSIEAGRCVWILAYSLAVAACWLRVLRCFYLSKVGIVVSIFFAMFRDVLFFLVVYAILLFVFSMLYLGTTTSAFAIIPGRVNGTCALPSGDDGPPNGSSLSSGMHDERALKIAL